MTNFPTFNVTVYGNAFTVSGARNIVITDNVVVNAEWAYDIGVENCIIAGHIVLESNTATGSYFGDFLLGAYATDGYKENPGIGCDPLSSSDENEGHGYVENITVKNNQFNTTTPIDDQGTINLQYRIRQSIIIQTGIAEQHPDGVVSGDENSIRVVE